MHGTAVDHTVQPASLLTACRGSCVAGLSTVLGTGMPLPCMSASLAGQFVMHTVSALRCAGLGCMC